MPNPEIPKIRPVGSPLAKKYGATNSIGEPVKNLVPVKKSQRVVSRRDGMSPNEIANGRTPDDGRSASIAALRLLHGPSLAQLERLQRVAKAKAKSSTQVAVYDANGTLIGVIDPDDIVKLGSTTPPATSAPAAAPMPGPGDNPGVVPVAKSRLLRTSRVVRSISQQNADFHAKLALKRGRR